MKTMLPKMMKVATAVLVAVNATFSASAEAVTADDVTAVVAGWKNAREALGEQLTAEPVRGGLAFRLARDTSTKVAER